MIRQCPCGCRNFSAKIIRRLETDGEVLFNGGEKAEITVENNGDIDEKTEFYTGSFMCLDCGAVYETEDDIPTV